jgi:hypothetical protein
VAVNIFDSLVVIATIIVTNDIDDGETRRYKAAYRMS